MAKTTKYKNFCIFILTHGNPNNVSTYKMLMGKNCTYPIYFILDDEDKTRSNYIKNFGKENVFIFSKDEYMKKIDTMDNFGIKKIILYARHFSYDLAKKLKYKYFLQLDDDYTSILFRINKDLEHPKHCWGVKNIDFVIDAFLDYFRKTPFKSIAMSQGGDWFGGRTSFNKEPKRKAMNSFFCKTNEKIDFAGSLNEDVTAYVMNQSRGNLFLTIPHIQITQKSTQNTKGSITDVYLDQGTYVKSFYTIIGAPSCVGITSMGVTDRRLHHVINWNIAVPKIISEKHKKS